MQQCCICANAAALFDLLQVGPDKDWSLVFAVFDENKSWYMKENIHNTTQTPAGYNDTNPDVYNSHVIYSELMATSSILVDQIMQKCHGATMIQIV